MLKILQILFFWVFFSVTVFAQRQPDHISADSSDIRFWLDAYKKVLKKKPLLYLSLDSADAIKSTGLSASKESFVKLLNVKSRPDWSLGIDASAPLFLPGIVNYEVMTGNIISEDEITNYTKTLPTLGFSTGLNFQYFFYCKVKKENPFVETDNPEQNIKKFYRAPNYFSVLGGVQYQIDYYNFTQLNDLLLSEYSVLVRTELQKMAIPLVARYHINLNKNPKSVKTIGDININNPSVSKNALFIGAGLHLAYIFSANRFFRYINNDNQQLLTALFTDAINWTGNDNARFPYPQSIMSKSGFNNLQLDLFAEFGYRVRINSKYKLPQYVNIALAYKFPLISYYYNNNSDLNSINNEEIFTVGYRDITNIQRIGSIQLSLGFEIQHHKITDRYNKK